MATADGTVLSSRHVCAPIGSFSQATEGPLGRHAATEAPPCPPGARRLQGHAGAGSVTAQAASADKGLAPCGGPRRAP